MNAAVSWLVPKPHTPFGWIAQQKIDYFRKAKQKLLEEKKSLRGASIKLKFHHLERSILEGVFARGDRRLSRVLEEAYTAGAKFDAWDECFDYNRYLEAFAKCGLDPAFYAHRERGENEVLPWDHLGGDNREQLYKRLQRITEMLNIV